MKSNRIKIYAAAIPAGILIAFLGVDLSYAADLMYANREQRAYGAAPSLDVDPGDPTGVAPVVHSTDYSTQFYPSSSFMQQPPAAGQYGANMMSPYGSSPYGNPGGMGGSPADPYMASEVSPYSRYTPYIEVVGEGSNYTLGVDDVVTVIVRNQPDFSGRFIIDPEGNIQYNFAGDIKAAGKTKEELKVEIVERLRKFVRYPEVAVMISEYRSKSVYVFGFVNRPGKYAMKGDKITLKEAVVAAGLPRVDAAIKRVYVVRPSQYTENGKSAKRKVNLKKLLQKGDSAEDFMLEPGDTLVVDQKNFDRFVNTFSRLVGPLFQAAAVYELGFGGDGNGFLRPNATD